MLTVTLWRGQGGPLVLTSDGDEKHSADGDAVTWTGRAVNANI